MISLEDIQSKEMPMIALQNAVIFPIINLPIPVPFEGDESFQLIEEAREGEGLVFIVAQRGERKPQGDAEIYSIGTIARILHISHNSSGHEILVEGIARGQLEEIWPLELGGEMVSVKVLPEDQGEPPVQEALGRVLRELALKIIRLSPHLPPEALKLIEGIKDPGHLADLVASQLRLDLSEKQKILELSGVMSRIQEVIKHIAHEVAVLELSHGIRSDVKVNLDKHQREHYLREKLRVIQRELGEDSGVDDLGELRLKVKEAQMPEAALKAAERELKRLARMNPQSAEYTVARTYIDWLVDTPWVKTTEDNLDINAAEQVLEKHHYGLTRVKQRIVEYLAVRKLKGDMKGPILCLIGPPGVGKTSLGRSIAETLGRKFVQVSLGGMRDEAEIRGHRRTYIGALPGRIIKGLKRAENMNPVFVLDEIDKLGNDFRGDPASALLEVLDPEQNFAFSDHYLEVPVDLSKVLFITTANRRDTIPSALLDRMEVIEMPSYIHEEKIQIAQRHLLPRQLEEHGLNPKQVDLNQEAFQALVSRYTREAGVRNLSREIASVLRSVAKDVALGEVELPVMVDAARVRLALGPHKFFPEMKEDIATPGVAVGLAWTPVGGEILFIEASAMKGSGKLILTGQLGEVMKESAQAAMSFIHARAEELEIKEECFSAQNVHLHLPSGAIPKDGPSAGVAIVTALTSLFSGRCMRDGLAMTGEITLRGVVMPVGGVKEKILAAHRAGISEIILPGRNRGDLEEIPEKIRGELSFHLVDRIEEVLKLVFQPS